MTDDAAAGLTHETLTGIGVPEHTDLAWRLGFLAGRLGMKEEAPAPVERVAGPNATLTVNQNPARDWLEAKQWPEDGATVEAFDATGNAGTGTFTVVPGGEDGGSDRGFLVVGDEWIPWVDARIARWRAA